MPMEGSGDNKRRGMSGSHTFTFKYTTQNEYIGVYGIFERKE